MPNGNQLGAGSDLDQGVLEKTCDNRLAARVMSACGCSVTPLSETLDGVFCAPSSVLHLVGSVFWAPSSGLRP